MSGSVGRVSSWIWLAPLSIVAVAMPGGTGCTRESVRVAIESQRRADEVQQAVFDRQHDGLRLLLFRDLQRRLENASGAALSAGQQVELNRAWNERDLLEFWAIQFERSKALRTAGVDAKLFSDQSIVDLLLRGVPAMIGRMEQGVAAAAGGTVADQAMKAVSQEHDGSEKHGE